MVSLSTIGGAPTHLSPHTSEPVYYNNIAVLQHLAHGTSVQETKCHAHDSGDDSEDDHVDVATVNPALNPGKNEYYNVRQAISNHRNKHSGIPQPNYENFNPILVR